MCDDITTHFRRKSLIRQLASRENFSCFVCLLLGKRREFDFTEKISTKRQMSDDGAADIRVRARCMAVMWSGVSVPNKTRSAPTSFAAHSISFGMIERALDVSAYMPILTAIRVVQAVFSRIRSG